MAALGTDLVASLIGVTGKAATGGNWAGFFAELQVWLLV
jgi:hypothetical protein